MSRLRSLAAVATTVVATAVVPVALASDARADQNGTPPSGGCTGGSCTVNVTYSGNAAPSGGGGSSTPAVAPDCWYEPWLSVEEGLAVKIVTDFLGVFIPFLQLPLASLQEYKDAAEKHAGDAGWGWYRLTCKDGINSLTSEQAMSTAQTTEWFGMQVARMDLLVGPGQDTPTGVSVETLLEAAQNAIDIPDPEVQRNPRIQGSGAALVNLPTMFWSDVAQRSYSITASAGPVSATVTATQKGYTLTSPVGGVSCTYQQFTTPYRAGQPEGRGCRISFSRSNEEGWPVDVTASYDASWTATGFPAEQPLEAFTVATTVIVPVAQSQTVVNDTD